MTEHDIFTAAIKFAGDERAAFVQAACGGDEALRRAVEALLEAHDPSGGLVPRHTARDLETTPFLPQQAAPATVIAGRYKLVQPVGQGGMGTVWLAEQSEPVKRRVAVKLVKSGLDSAQVLARFQAERQALALMDHPNIAKVFDGGITDQGRPYFVMEFVQGVPITEYCDQARLSPAERLALFVPICQAVQHAHQKGILHRDLKPSNLLVCRYDGRPVPKVIDFGLAKAMHQPLTDLSLHTALGLMVGTPLYMSPEQAEPSNQDVDTRTDIYSLGVVLYELLTGTTPLERRQLHEAAYAEVLRLIKEVEPPRPSTRLGGSAALPSVAAQRGIEPRQLCRLVAGDLDWIVMKALDKERSRRYETANGLARDLERYLHDEPVEATPPTAEYRLRKFARRHRKVLATATGFALVLLTGTVVSTALAYRATRAEGRARDALESESRQRAVAERREQEAIDAVKRFGDAVAQNPELKNREELESLRKTLLKEPLEFLRSLREQLEKELGTRPESLDQLAIVAFDLANLTNEIGDKQDALRAYREALALMERLAREHATVTHFQHDLAGIHNNIGILLHDLGQLPEALAAFEQARAICARNALEHPDVIRFQSGVASAHNNIGNVLRHMGQLDEALAAHEQARTINERLARAYPAVIEYRSDLSASHNNIGRLLHYLGELDRGLAALEQARVIRQQLVTEDATDAGLLSDLADTHNNIGLVLKDTGRPDEALAANEQARTIRERLARENPAVIKFQSDLAGAHLNFGMLLSANGHQAEALDAYEQGRAIYARLAGEHPGVADFQHGLAVSRKSAGLELLATAMWDEALAAFEHARVVFLRLAEEQPKDEEFQSGLARSWYMIGIVYAAMERPGEALPAYHQALDIFERQVQEFPLVTEFRSDLVACYDNVAMLLATTGKPDEARDTLEKALAIQERLAQELPTVPEFQSALGRILNNLAQLDLNARRFAEARVRLLSAIDHQKRAVASFPRHPGYRQSLRTHYAKLVEAAAGLEDSHLAAEAHKGLADLASADPRFDALDERITAALGGEPAENVRALLAMAHRAYDTRRFAVATRFFGEALDRDAALAEDRRTRHAYNAACCAALAGSGQGTDDPPPDEAARTKLRAEARAWLESELDRWSGFLDSAMPDRRSTVAATLRHWQTDPDLAGIRDPAELARLPASECAEWEALWKRVGELLARASVDPASEGRP